MTLEGRARRSSSRPLEAGGVHSGVMDDYRTTARRMTGALTFVAVGGLISLCVALVVGWDLIFGEGDDGRWWTLVTSCGVVVASIFTWFSFGSVRRKLLNRADEVSDEPM